MHRQQFTSESVTEGHPDKVCDRISDTVLDAMLEQDPSSRVAIETMATTGLIHVAGEVTTSSYVEIPRLVRQTIRDIGYTSSDIGFDGASCGVTLSIGQQSADISEGVTTSLEIREGMRSDDAFDRQGAGDQGLMFGYASNETSELMPAPIAFAHRLAERLAKVRKEGIVPGLRPDGKTQATIGYEGLRPVSLEAVVISTQHDEGVERPWLHEAMKEHVLDHVLQTQGLDLDVSDLRLFVNPSGKFVVGGPMGDAGLTGRKIIVDTYGGMARHGGGAFSGKDPSKVDRSPTPRDGRRRTSWPLGWRSAASFRSPTRSAAPVRSPCASTPSARRRRRWSGSSRRWPRSSTCGPRRSSRSSSSNARYMRRRRPTGISGARASPGSGRIASTSFCAPSDPEAERTCALSQAAVEAMRIQAPHGRPLDPHSKLAARLPQKASEALGLMDAWT